MSALAWPARRGRERTLDLLPGYLDRLVAGCAPLPAPLRVVVDAGNGVAGLTAPEALRRLGCEVNELYCDPDGRFPNHHPDPLVPANLAALRARVRFGRAGSGVTGSFATGFARGGASGGGAVRRAAGSGN